MYQKILTIFFDLREKNFFFRDYYFLISEAKYKAKYEKGLEKVSPKQMPQRLAIVLAQVKASKTFENLVNEIRQIIYSL